MNEITVSLIIVAALAAYAIITHIISKKDWVDVDGRDSWLNPTKTIACIVAVVLLLGTVALSVTVPSCPECNARGTGKYCEECGAAFAVYTCEECGHEYSSIVHLPNYCSDCGTAIKAK